jgi:hypothetical protein
MVERWFPDADTNTVLLFLERCSNAGTRRENDIRFVRLRRPLSTLLPEVGNPQRRQVLEDLVDQLLVLPDGGEDPRWAVNVVAQGDEGGMTFNDAHEEDLKYEQDDENQDED